jgi:tripartite-type tricarboxylate transporter receptor subunit TctC
MPNLTRRKLMTGAAALAAYSALSSLRVEAQDYPQRPLRIIVPYAAGGASDTNARLIAQRLERDLGQPLVVDNRGGGASIVGTQAIAQATPDGYTLGVVDSAFTINPTLFKDKLPYDTRRDFAPVSLLTTSPLVLLVHPDVPAKNVAELIALAKAKPGTINYASYGSGSQPHLSGELLKHSAGIDLVHVPYKGAAPAMNDLIAGHIPILFDNMPAVLPQVAGGSVRAIAVAGAKRASALPDVPTLAEQGVTGFEAFSWFGLVAPAKTPAPMLDALQAEVEKVLKMPDVEKRLAELGAERGALSGAAFGKFLAEDSAKWTKIIQASGATAD